MMRCLHQTASRFWPLEGYKKGQGQPSYDKQFVRNWLLANPDSDYLLPDDIIEKTVDKYTRKPISFLLVKISNTSLIIILQSMPKTDVV